MSDDTGTSSISFDFRMRCVMPPSNKIASEDIVWKLAVEPQEVILQSRTEGEPLAEAPHPGPRRGPGQAAQGPAAPGTCPRSTTTATRHGCNWPTRLDLGRRPRHRLGPAPSPAPRLTHVHRPHHQDHQAEPVEPAPTRASSGKSDTPKITIGGDHNPTTRRS